jgi:hypothetical protein
MMAIDLPAGRGVLCAVVVSRIGSSAPRGTEDPIASA